MKFLLDQRLSTVPQHQWLSKLFGFDFTVEYRPGRLNAAADALSRHDEDILTAVAVSGPSFCLYDDIQAAMATDLEAGDLVQRLAAGSLEDP